MSGIAGYDRYDGLGLAALVRRRQVTPLELLETAIDRVERINPAINAVTGKIYDRARDAIRAGLPDGPFMGVPYLLKDLAVHLQGSVTTFGSRLFADAAPAGHDSELVTRLKRSGLVIFGKTTTPEFGLTTTTESRLAGQTRNPWALDRSAGGSSGGAAAAVAARILPMAHATDGGGSIRIPASACGLFGLKTTRARNPAGPDVGEGWAGAAVGHAVTISVRDSAALLDATAGPDIGDPYWSTPRPGSYLSEVGRDPGRLRIAVATRPWNGSEVHADCLAAVADAAKLCQSLGHHLEEARPEVDAERLGWATRTVIGANVRASIVARAAELGREPTADDVEPMSWSMAEIGRTATAADYAASVLAIHRIGRAVARFFTRYDLLLTPTMCKPPLPLGTVAQTQPDAALYTREILGTIAFTSLFNSTGMPAMSVPLFWTADDLPVGVQFAAPFGGEATLLRLAAQLEAARPWADRKPPVCA